MLTETFSTLWPGAPHRVLRSCIDAALTVSGDTIATVTFGDQQLPIPRRGPLPPIRATIGEIPAMPLYAGQGVGAVNAIRPAGDIVRELADGAARLLADSGVREAVSR